MFEVYLLSPRSVFFRQFKLDFVARAGHQFQIFKIAKKGGGKIV